VQQGNLEEEQHQQSVRTRCVPVRTDAYQYAPSTLNLEINILGEQQQQHHRTLELEIGEEQDWGEIRWEETYGIQEKTKRARAMVVSEPTSNSIAGMSKGLADGGTGHKQRRREQISSLFVREQVTFVQH
jgi:hypothetical protein